MAGTVREARLGTPTARARLEPGRQPHWNTVVAGKAHLGYQRWEDDKVGRWVLRRRVEGKYSTEPIGAADDDRRPPDGIGVFSYEQARAKALDLSSAEARPAGRLTVARALQDYFDSLKAAGRDTSHAESAAAVHITPKLGTQEVAALTSSQLRRWVGGVAAQPARKRPKLGRAQFKEEPSSDEAVRRRRASANRILSVLKAALNHAFDEGRVASNTAWGRRVKKFKSVDAARARYLSAADAVRLISACDSDFRPLVRAALETGMRYGELTNLEIGDFNADAGTIHVRKSKSGKARHVALTEEGARFFRRFCAGRSGSDVMFTRGDGEPWQRSNQGRYMAEACANGQVKPAIHFHCLRHTWASLAVMGGVPLMVVARNLGHVDTRMVERVYGHLAPSFVTDAIRSGAPRFAVGDDSNVEVLRLSEPSKKY